MKRKNFTVSVVVPAFNEEGNIEPLVKKLKGALSVYPKYEILFIDDGSNDKTLDTLKSLVRGNNRLRYLSLSRNFGHQNAIKAGLDHASGDCVIMMDADLQHPPDMIPQLIEKWQEGYDIVTTQRMDIPKVALLKRMTSGLFYRILNRMSDINIPKGAADFRLLDRKVVNVLKDTKEYFLFFRGMTAWVGFRQYSLEYIPEKRLAGKSKYSLKHMLGFALTGITSFSLKPLRVSILLGVFFAVLAFAYGIYAVLMKLLTNQAVLGWASVLASVLFIGGIQLVVLGIIGEYIGKLFMESKQRPHYIIREKSSPSIHHSLESKRISNIEESISPQPQKTSSQKVRTNSRHRYSSPLKDQNQKSRKRDSSGKNNSYRNSNRPGKWKKSKEENNRSS